MCCCGFGNSSILRIRLNLFLEKPDFLFSPAPWTSRHILSVVLIRFGNASLTFQSQPSVWGFMSPCF